MGEVNFSLITGKIAFAAAVPPELHARVQVMPWLARHLNQVKSAGYELHAFMVTSAPVRADGSIGFLGVEADFTDPQGKRIKQNYFIGKDSACVLMLYKIEGGAMTGRLRRAVGEDPRYYALVFDKTSVTYGNTIPYGILGGSLPLDRPRTLSSQERIGLTVKLFNERYGIEIDPREMEFVHATHTWEYMVEQSHHYLVKRKISRDAMNDVLSRTKKSDYFSISFTPLDTLWNSVSGNGDYHPGERNTQLTLLRVANEYPVIARDMFRKPRWTKRLARNTIGLVSY